MIFPGAGYVYIACRLAAAHHKQKFEDFDVEIEDVRFHNACFISYDKDAELMAVYQGGDGKFEVREGKTLMCTGFIRPGATCKFTAPDPKDSSHVPDMTGDEFYKELRIRGYNYEKLFRNVVAAKIDGSEVKARWENNWIAFFDNLAQLTIITKDSRGPLVPIRIRRILLKPREFLLQAEQFDKMDDEQRVATAFYDADLDMVHCPGMEFRGFTFTSIPRMPHRGLHVMGSYEFVPHVEGAVMSGGDAAKVIVQLAMENSVMLKIKSVEINEDEDVFNEFIAKAIESVPVVTPELVLLTNRTVEDAPHLVVDKIENFKAQKSIDLLVKKGCVGDHGFLGSIAPQLNENAFVICREEVKTAEPAGLPDGMHLIAIIRLENEKIFVVRYGKQAITPSEPSEPSKPEPTQSEPSLTSQPPTKVIKITSKNFNWLDQLKETIKDNPTIVFAQNESDSGILGLVNCIRREPNCGHLRCVFIDDEKAPEFDVENDFYKKQLTKGLAVNVYR
jgi:fatty acid synthase